jgi:carotenoid cleavage dioxygenase-like enzyme
MRSDNDYFRPSIRIHDYTVASSCIIGKRVHDRGELHRRRCRAHTAALSGTGLLGPAGNCSISLWHADWSDGSVEVYQAPEGHYLGGEPVFIAAAKGGSGAAGDVTCQDFDAVNRESFFDVFDAAHVARGPVARVRLPQPIPFGFRVSFDRNRSRSIRTVEG